MPLIKSVNQISISFQNSLDANAKLALKTSEFKTKYPSGHHGKTKSDFAQLAKLAAKKAGQIAQLTQKRRVGLLGDNSLTTYVLALAIIISKNDRLAQFSLINYRTVSTGKR